SPGAAHRVNAKSLAEAARDWAPRFAHLPRPWVGLMVGGDTRRRPFTPEMAGELARRAAALAAGGALLVTTSRRTTPMAAQALFADLPGPLYAHRWGEAGDNPYLGILALADALVVTGDSVSMCCEACAAPAPVYVWAPEGWVTDKHARLHRMLFEQGYARPLPESGRLHAWSHPPLDPAAEIAAAIRARLEC
ncbi:MAG: nucleoside-diphosphate sugar epimerase, partial [Magnetospirillum sp.]